MSSTLQSQARQQQWWSRTSKSQTLGYHTHSTADSPATTPTSPVSSQQLSYTNEESSSRQTKSSKKFNTLASVMGFKTKKSHPKIDIPPGPSSPPLPLQKPPTHDSPSQISRSLTYSSTSSYPYDPKSPGEPSIYTYPSSEEAYEPITPSDQLSRHRTSYQPSLFTFAEQQDHSPVSSRLGDVGFVPRFLPPDPKRVSVMSDPSIIDPHFPGEPAIRTSRASTASYYSTANEPRTHLGRFPQGLRARDSLEKRKSSGCAIFPSFNYRVITNTFSSDSRLSEEINLTLDTETNGLHRGSVELHPRDQRYSDTGLPAVSQVSTSYLMSSQRPGLKKSPSATAAIPVNVSSRTNSPYVEKMTLDTSNYRVEEDRIGRNRIASLRADSPRVDYSPPSSARLSPSTRPKALTFSNGSSSAVNASIRPSPSIITSFSPTASLSRNVSVASGTSSYSGSLSGSMRRQPSASRLRPVPPSRTPPTSHLPPTPLEQPPSPLTFRSPRNLSPSSLGNTPLSETGDDPSVMAFDLPLSSASESESSSSASLRFAQPDSSFPYDDFEHEPISTYHMRMRSPRSNPRLTRDEIYSSSRSTHTTKSSLSSNHTLMTALGARGDTPTQRSLKKSVSQSSMSILMAGNLQEERQRVDSETSNASAAVMSEESTASKFNSMRSIRKQRSLHNTRAPGGSLALPPLPQQLRHANSFNTPAIEASNKRTGHTKNDSLSSPFGTQRRSTVSNPTSQVNTPTTPQIYKKRSLFSSHGRDRRDSNPAHEKERPTSGGYISDQGDKKKNSIGLGLFYGLSSPNGHLPTQINEFRRGSTPSIDDFSMKQPPSSPILQPQTYSTPSLDQHILPPKELLSQMEALADTESPESPPLSSTKGFDSELEDDLWDSSSIATTDKQSMRSRVNSISGTSETFGSEESGAKFDSLPLSPTRHFTGATGSIQSRLEANRPSTTSKLPTRNFSNLSRSSITSSNGRPSTADTVSSIREFGVTPSSNRNSYAPPTALPPPPRRKGTAVASRLTNCEEETAPNPLSSSPRYGPPHLSRQPPADNPGLQRYASHETLNASTYNPNRGSIFRKPSFLNIDDDFSEPISSSIDTMDSVPEDSFLILEHGKDSLDLSRNMGISDN